MYREDNILQRVGWGYFRRSFKYALRPLAPACCINYQSVAYTSVTDDFYGLFVTVGPCCRVAWRAKPFVGYVDDCCCRVGVKQVFHIHPEACGFLEVGIFVASCRVMSVEYCYQMVFLTESDEFFQFSDRRTWKASAGAELDTERVTSDTLGCRDYGVFFAFLPAPWIVGPAHYKIIAVGIKQSGPWYFKRAFILCRGQQW